MVSGPVDRTAVYQDAVRRLRSHQKTSKGAPAYSRFVNRRVGRRLAALSYAWGLTPNQVTLLSAVFTFSSIVGIPFAGTSFLHGVLVSAGLLFGYALDSADGQLARLRGGGSPAGEWLDHVLDSTKSATIHLAVLLHLSRREGLDDAVLLMPLAFAAVANVWFFTVILTGQLRERHGGAVAAPAARRAPVLRSVLALPTDYGILCLVFVLLSVTELFLGAYVLLLVGTVAFLGAALPTWFREMQLLQPAAPRGR